MLLALARGLARMLLCVSSALHLYFGIGFILDPGAWMENLAIAATSPAGLVEMRAFYGGLLSSLGLLFAMSALFPQALVPGTILLTVTYAGAACVRAYGMGVTDTHDVWLGQLLGIEASSALLGALALLLIGFAGRWGRGDREGSRRDR